jgi:hypothetical protein
MFRPKHAAIWTNKEYMLCSTYCKFVFMYFSVLAGVPHATTHLLLFGLIAWTKSYEELKSRSCSLFIFSSLLFYFSVFNPGIFLSTPFQPLSAQFIPLI